MATQNKKPVRPLRRMSGGPICPSYFPEAASQTFKKGELVYLSSGYVTEYTVDVDDDSTRLLGVAAEDAHNGTAGANRVGVYLPDDDLIFIGSIYHGTAASAVLAVTDYGALLPFAYDTTNSRVYVDKENTAGQEDCCRIVGIWADEAPHEEAIGDLYPQVMFIIEAINRTIGQ